MASSGRGESQPKRGRYQLAAKEFTVHYAEGRKYRAVWDDRYNPSIHGDEASPQQEFEIALRYQNPQAENGAQFPAATPEPDPQVAKFLRDKRQTANRHGDPHEIRVFELLPSPSDSDDVVGKLHAVSVGFKYERRRPTRHGVSLTEGLPVCYTALSYVWGTSCCNSTITIDGQAKHITDALLVALQHLRHPTISVMLWIDQICIDQEDMKDKESQIKLMGAIYQRAWNTVIWLGPEQDRGAFRALHGMYEVMRYVEGDLLEEQLQHFRYTSPEQREEYDSLMALLNNPWFKRTWIIQEAILSADAYLMAGASVVPFLDFALWYESIAPHGIVRFLRQDASGSQAQPADTLTVVVTMYQHAIASRTLVDWKDQILIVLVETRSAQVTNPLDKVYGLLGLSLDCGISPDYSKTTSGLYHEVAVGCLVRGMELDRQASKARLRVPEKLGDSTFLRAYEKSRYWTGYQILSCIDHESSETGLASWVPDWSKPRMTSSLGFGASPWALYRAGGSSDYPPLSFENGERSLLVTVRLFDIITHLSSVLESAVLSEHEPAKTNTSLQESIRFVGAHAISSVMAEGVFLTLAQTLVAGRDGTGKLKYPTEYTEIFSLLCDETSGRCPSVPDQTYTQRQAKGRLSLGHLRVRGAGRAFQGLKKAYRAAVLNRRLSFSRKGYLGLVPRYAREGDVLCTLPGASVPFVVRAKSDGAYELLGECYVHDLMDGRFSDDRAVESQVIKLV